MVIETPSGYKVTIKDNFTYGDYKKLIKSFLKTSEVDFDKTTTDKVALKNMTADKLIEYQEFAIDILINKIEIGDKVITSDFKKTIDEWSIQDGESVYSEISKIIAKTQGEKK